MIHEHLAWRLPLLAGWLTKAGRRRRAEASTVRPKQASHRRSGLVGLALAVAASSGLALAGTVPAQAATTSDIAQLALDNIGKMACSTNSLGGLYYESSCIGHAGVPEFWCADFAKWVWEHEGVQGTEPLNALAHSFYTYGQTNATFSTTPKVGDAAVFSNDGTPDQIHHVAIVTQVNSDGTIETVSGDWNGEPGDEEHFASTSHVVLNAPAYSSTPGWTPSMGFYLVGYVSPVGVGQPARHGGPGGDINGDGKDDIYWAESNGRLSGFFSNGSTLGIKLLATNIGSGTGWMGVGDIDGDGRADVYRYELNGRLYGIFSRGSTVSIKELAGNVGGMPLWAGVGDINGDGKDDIYWAESNGRLSGFFSNGSTLGIKLLATNIGSGTGWMGVGDIDGDGRADVYRYELNGRLYGIFSRGSTVSIKELAGNVGGMPLWAGVGDINGDGKDDIYWAESNGRLSGFFSNGSTLGIKLLATNIGSGTGWMGVGDIDGDGRADVYRYELNGRLYGIFSRGSTVSIKELASNVGGLPLWAGNGSMPGTNGSGIVPAG